MKKYWKGIGLCVFLLIAIIIGIRSCEIERPEDVVSSNKGEITEVEQKDNESVSEIVNNEEKTPSEVTTNSKTEESSNSTKSVAQGENKNATQINQAPSDSNPVTTIDKEKDLYCTLTIECKSILNNMDKLSPNLKDNVPKDGIIYSTRTVAYKDGENVFDILQRITQANNIQMEHNGGSYIKGINNLYEFDCGSSSGWKYSVNGDFRRESVSQYKIKSGDDIQFIYSI